MTAISDVQAVGFDASVAFSLPGDVKVYRVSGFGVDIYVRSDDADALASLVDPAAQAVRAEQFQAES